MPKGMLKPVFGHMLTTSEQSDHCLSVNVGVGVGIEFSCARDIEIFLEESDMFSRNLHGYIIDLDRMQGQDYQF